MIPTSLVSLPLASATPRSCGLRRLWLGMILSVAATGSAFAQCGWLPGAYFDLSTGTMAGSGITEMLVLPGGDLIAAGGFDHIGGVAANNIARWNGSAWAPLGSGTDGPVIALALAPNGDIVVGGGFNTAGAQAATNIARWDGTSWSGFGAGLSNSVGDVAVLTTGEVIALTTGLVMRWAGANWTLIGTPAGGSAYAVEALPNGDAVIGGSFTSMGGLASSAVVRWSSGTSTWVAMGIPSFLPPVVYSLAILPGGLVLAGGYLPAVGTAITAWNGAGWNALASPFQDWNTKLTAVPNGHLIATGPINGVQSATCEWDGTTWTQWALDPGPGSLNCGCRAPGGEVYVAGNFSTIMGVASRGIARNACGAGLAVASNYGNGCGATATLYEQFASVSFDLSQSTLEFAFDGAGYQVSQLPGTPTWVAPASTALPMTDDSLSAPISLPFPIPYPGGSTSQIKVGSNGFVYLQAGSAASAFYGNLPSLLNGTPRWAPMWGDLDPGPSGGGSVYVDIDSVGQVVRVTWVNVQEYGHPGNLSTFQVVAEGTGNVEFRYLNCAATLASLAGWSPGGGAHDHSSVDLTAAGPFFCGPDALPLQHDASARPVLGATISLDTTSVPANSLLGATILGLTQFDPGIDLGFLGMPGCFAFASFDVFATAIPSVPSFSFGLAVPNDLTLVGLHVYSQGIALVMGATPFGFITSNGVDLLVGDV